MSHRLTDSDYFTWSQAIVVLLQFIELDQYLLNDTLISDTYHNAIKHLLCS